jgi:hypothetical protein
LVIKSFVFRQENIIFAPDKRMAALEKSVRSLDKVEMNVLTSFDKGDNAGQVRESNPKERKL